MSGDLRSLRDYINGGLAVSKSRTGMTGGLNGQLSGGFHT
jgi:hypothetical protein